MESLSKIRFTPSIRPFTSVCIDYIGYLEVKVERSLVKPHLPYSKNGPPGARIQSFNEVLRDGIQAIWQPASCFARGVLR